ncbi:MAG: EutN/CcmL family microcompartment protein [Candidatus Sumerlaeia bacterium]|nr:EutN/CcmL family microcompartment protein [Candidatus Sumerlaeia bacterium]
MQLGIVVGSIWSSEKHAAYEGRKQLLVQRVDLDRKPVGHPTVAIDYVNAGVGDTVLLGAAPGLASVVFKIKIAPIQTLVMGVVDRVEAPGHQPFGNSVASHGSDARRASGAKRRPKSAG